MCWQCDHPEATVDDYLDELRDTIRRHRWVVQYVEDDRRPFAYTIGLHDLGLPELMITGLRAQTAYGVLNCTARMMVDDGMVPAPPMHINHHGDFLLEVVEVDHPDVHLTFAVALCGPRIRALQLVWADNRGHWPWDRGWSHGRRRQAVFGKRISQP
jgi:Domain of unknown function (DUF4262)